MVGTTRGTVLGRDLAVDLGTASTQVYVRGRGVVLDEPSLVALDDDGELVAAGRSARRFAGSPGAHLVSPVHDGVVADFDAAEQMLHRFIVAARGRGWTRPRLVVAMPSGVTAVEQRVVREVGYQAGARQVEVIEEPMAAAIGAGLPVHESGATMVVDIGCGTTEVALITLGSVAVARSIRTAGAALDRAVSAWLASAHRLVVDDTTAEQLKMTLGSAFSDVAERHAEVIGHDADSADVRRVVVSASEVRQALDDPLRNIVDVVRATVDQASSRLARDVRDHGLVLTGGGALLPGLDELVRREVGIPVHVAAEPRACVVSGAARCVEQYAALQPLLVPERRRAG
jgi:rod shape-determining protein MreB and related proteins